MDIIIFFFPLIEKRGGKETNIAAPNLASIGPQTMNDDPTQFLH
jgi:hypothetical protein